MNQFYATIEEELEDHKSQALADGSTIGAFGASPKAEENYGGWLLDRIGVRVDLIPSEADLPAYIAAAEALYDKYVAPFDLPYVPNWLEPFVDNGIRQGIAPGIRKLYAVLHAGS